MEVNSNRSNSMTSVGSTGSTDSGFGVNDGQSPVGHMGPKSVTTAAANQKPLGFFGWLKSLIFGSGGSKADPFTMNLKPTSKEILEGYAAKDQAYENSKQQVVLHPKESSPEPRDLLSPHLPARDKENYSAAFQDRTANEFHAAISGVKKFSTAPSSDDVEFTDEEVALLAANRAQRRGYEHASDLRSTAQQVENLKTAIGKLIEAAKNRDLNDNSREIRKEPKQKLTETLTTCNEALAALSARNSSYRPDGETITQLDTAGLSYDSATKTIGLKKN